MFYMLQCFSLLCSLLFDTPTYYIKSLIVNETVLPYILLLFMYHVQRDGKLKGKKTSKCLSKHLSYHELPDLTSFWNYTGGMNLVDLPKISKGLDDGGGEHCLRHQCKTMTLGRPV